MKIWCNRNRSSLAFSTTREERSIQCRTGRKLVLGLSILVCNLTILSANLLSHNTIRRRFLTRQELQKHSLRDVPSFYELNKTNTHPINIINPEQSKNFATHVILNA